MKLEFLGVGEAFDERHINSSYLLHGGEPLLFDCGYSLPPAYFARAFTPDFLSSIYISHFHADHTFGLPALITRLNEEGRTKPLQLLSQTGFREYLNTLMRSAYPGVLGRLKFPLEVIELESSTTLGAFQFDVAQSTHGVRNLALRIRGEGFSIGLSGDGDLTEATRALFQPCTHLVHEAFSLNDEFPNHASGKTVIEFARHSGRIKELYLVHLRRSERKRVDDGEDLLPKFADNTSFSVHVPREGEMMTLSTPKN